MLLLLTKLAQMEIDEMNGKVQPAKKKSSSKVRRKTPKEWEAVLKQNVLPSAPGPVLDARWIARSGDWWVETAQGWFWLRAGTQPAWVHAPNGPP